MGFSGGFLDDSKAYFVPSHNSRGQGAKLVRVAARNFTSENVEVTNHGVLSRDAFREEWSARFVNTFSLN